VELLYCGVGQPYPWPEVARGAAGDALYTNSTLALDPDTGEIVWYRQFLPGDSLDLDEVFEHVLIDVAGQPRLYKIGKGGTLWVVNRQTGEFIAHRQLVYNNVYDVDPQSGAVTL